MSKSSESRTVGRSQQEMSGSSVDPRPSTPRPNVRPSDCPTIRWFSPNRFCDLVIPGLRAAGYEITTDGDNPADLAVAMDDDCAVAAFEFSRRHRCRLLLYLWDLPPWRLGSGQPDVVFEWRNRVRRVPRIVGGYRERPGFYSRLRYIARRADCVWAPSRLTVCDLARRFGVMAAEVPYCFDSDRFQFVDWEPRVPPRILVVSRLTGHKNQAAVIRAASRLTPRPVVHLIGQGPDGATLAGIAREHGVCLELASERQNDVAVAEAYRRATVVVAPSRFEGFGLTAMEAVATGIPAVASDIPPHRQHLGDAVTYFALEDDLSLIAAIRTALERGPVDPRALERLTIAAAVDRFLERIPGLLSEGR